MRELDALEEAQIELAHDVLASPEAGHLTGHDDLEHEIAHVLATLARAIGSGDPLRWSPPDGRDRPRPDPSRDAQR
ncbi:MAG TPA: hypothetical protein PK635_13810 [Actinomycetota bacterium]|nr:hypothetical protein [Actinomycetota bacterium]